MDTINKSVLMRFLNKIPDGYELEYNTLSFDKAVLMFSTDSTKAYLFSKNYRSPYLAKYTAELLKDAKSIDNIYAYHINKGKVSGFDWKNASKDIEYIINQFETDKKLPESASISSTVYNILLNDRSNNENSEFKNINPQFVARKIGMEFAFSDVRNIYQCQRKTDRTLNKLMIDLYDELVANYHNNYLQAPLTNKYEMDLIKTCLQPYFRSSKVNQVENLKANEQIGDHSIDELPTERVIFDEPVKNDIKKEELSKQKPKHTPDVIKENSFEK